MTAAAVAFLAATVLALSQREKDADTDMARRVGALESSRQIMTSRRWALLVGVVSSLVVVAATQVHLSFG